MICNLQILSIPVFINVTQHHEMMYFVKIDQLRYPDMTTALQTCYDINADWHTFFLEAIAFPLF
jgi:hypothetical protein